MPDYTVQQGDTISSIAYAHGLSNWRAIYDHPANASFRELRPDPNLIYPGDTVFVPERERPDFGAQATQEHTYRVRRPRNQLVIVLLDGDGDPLSEVSYTLSIEGGQTFTGTTDDDGRLEHPVAVNASNATLNYLGSDVELWIGWLDPPDTVEGVKARLMNLGYRISTVDGDDTSEEYQNAVRAFQEDQELEPDGIVSDATRARLVEVYGC